MRRGFEEEQDIIWRRGREASAEWKGASNNNKPIFFWLTFGVISPKTTIHKIADF